MDASQAQHQDGDLPEGWEQHKEAITRFYLEEDLPIAEVMKRMEREYGFCAKYNHPDHTSPASLDPIMLPYIISSSRLLACC
jgi:hypothetical protein